MKFPALLIVISASLWGLDSVLFRPSLHDLPVWTVVFVEHLVSLAFLAPVFLIWRSRQVTEAVEKFNWKGWLALLWVVLFGGVIGTYAITQAFFLVDFSGEVPVNISVIVLLQKLQPVFALLIAYAVLRERLTPFFWRLAGLAILASFVLAFSEMVLPLTEKVINIPLSIFGHRAPFSFGFPAVPVDENSNAAALLSLLAAFSWGSATVASRYLATKVRFSEATFLRFFGVVILMLPMILLIPGANAIGKISGNQWLLFLGIFASSGALALFLYYAGLRKTRASVSTICELAFPVTAMLGEYLIYGQTLSVVQWIAGGVLVYAVTKLVLVQHKHFVRKES